MEKIVTFAGNTDDNNFKQSIQLPFMQITKFMCKRVKYLAKRNFRLANLFIHLICVI